LREIVLRLVLLGLVLMGRSVKGKGDWFLRYDLIKRLGIGLLTLFGELKLMLDLPVSFTLIMILMTLMRERIEGITLMEFLVIWLLLIKVRIVRN
jgi:hypothetical protein